MSIILALSSGLAAVSARSFHSRDAFVRDIIATCEGAPCRYWDSDGSVCTRTLSCILYYVDNYTAARWSAGASILAFIPTIAGLMSNSIDELVLTAEHDCLLAILLALCSVTAFSSRFGPAVQNDDELINVSSVIRRQIENSSARVRSNTSPSKRLTFQYRIMRWTVLAMTRALLTAGCVAIYYAVWITARNGILLYSRPYVLHIPLWAGLTRGIALPSVLLKRSMHERVEIVLDQRGTQQSTATYSVQKSSSATTASMASPHPGPRARPTRVILRAKSNSCLASIVRATTTVLSFALYAFGTSFLAGMTMFPGSDAIRVMCMMAGSAGLSRVVGSVVLSRKDPYLDTIVIDVFENHISEIKSELSVL